MIPEGLKNSLNRMRELSTEIYHQYIPIITDDTDIATFGQPILNVPEVQNEFMGRLINRIVYTQFEMKYFRNPLQVLEGDRIPLGYAGQEIYTNPAKGRKYDAEDFAGLLQKYEADVKVQYTQVNMDLQYPVTVGRNKLKQAFVSWNDLNAFIDELSNSLYNGAYIDEYMLTKGLVSSAYKNNSVVIEEVGAINSEEVAKQFVTKAREYFLNFQTPSTKFNAWAKVGGAGRPVKTWSLKEDIVFLIRNDILSYLDVNVLANSFNIDKTTLLGNIIGVNNFDILNEDDTVNFDSSAIIGIMADKSWFRIKRQDMYLDEFYNANNRTWQYYLNLTKMYNYSLFANGVVFATAAPDTTIRELDYNNTPIVEVKNGQTQGLDVNVTPNTATTPTIVYTTSNESVFTVQADAQNNRHCTVTATGQGTAILTATAGDVKTEITINVIA